LGTSNWQQIPFCIEALMKIAPRRVLDVGVGFGRWGIIVREFCDVWYQRVFKDQWEVHLEGIEAFPRSIVDYHREFYNKIHIGDAAQIVPALPGPWDVVIYGDVLEHFTKEQAHQLLHTSLERSEYVIVNIPIGEEHPQGELYGNSFERHLSSWQVADFRPFGLVRHVLLKDYIERDYGSFVLSRRDPKDLRASLFSKAFSNGHPASANGGPGLDHVLERIAEQSFELNFIKGSASYRLADRLRRAPIGKAARRLKSGDTQRVRVRPLPRPGKSTTEAWVLSVHATPNEPGIPWDFVERTREFEPRPSEGSAYGRCLCGMGGEMSVRTGPDPKIRFMTHQYSGLVEVEFNGRSETIDLSSFKDGTVSVYPGRTPMVEARALEREDSPAARSMIEAAPAPAPVTNDGFTPAEIATIERLRTLRPAVVAVHCPRWLGVTSSTRTLFGDAACYPLPQEAASDPQSLSERELGRHARILAEAGIKHLIISGGDLPHLRLFEMLRALDPDASCDLLWHGSYVQVAEDYVWLILQRWIEAVRDGRVRSILTVKAGMEEFFRANGVPSELLHNYVPGEPLLPPQLDGEESHVGLWISSASFRKLPHAMISALSMIENVRLHAAGLDGRARELVEFLKIPVARCEPRPLPQEQLREAIRATHLSLYVTFSECCPMLPLESLQQGVPCLVGPVSHLFEDNGYLRERLVVPYPDRAEVIAAYARRAIAEREEIVAEWARYAPRYNAMAHERVARLLAQGVPAIVTPVREPAATAAS
jgi:hypothetical protein